MEIFWLLATFISLSLSQFISYDAYHEENLPKILSLDGDSEYNVIKQFNTTRIPGSLESQHIQEFMINYFRNRLDHDWKIEKDTFYENGHNFTNLVFSSDKAERYVVFAAHYDSKLDPEGFIGGIDSAVPCAILVYLAHFIDFLYISERDLIDQTLSGSYLGIKIVFFDGEEAFEQWSPTDSIYGARHLASVWDKEDLLDTIDLFVLMDLIGGSENVKIPSFFADSHMYYEMLSEIEDAYLQKNNNRAKSLEPANHRFLEKRQVVIDDDHLPFFKAGIDILHLIPFPFPKSWHTIDDNFNNLSQQEIYKWANLMCEFVISVAKLYT